MDSVCLSLLKTNEGLGGGDEVNMQWDHCCLGLSPILDFYFLKDLHLMTLFEEHIGSYENGQASFEELTQKVLGDRVETVPGEKMSSIFVEKKYYHGKKWYDVLKKKKRYGTTSSTSFDVKRVLEVTEEVAVLALEETFYELYHSRGRRFTFDIIEA